MKDRIYNLFMSYRTAIAIACGIVLLIAGGSAHAATSDFEVIDSFSSHVTVNMDNSVSVTETISYETGPTPRHGIYRDIYPYSSDDRYMNIIVRSVTDDRGATQPFTADKKGSYVRIKIGDPDQTFTGKRTYVIGYLATNAVSHLDTVDEIYWNVTGDDWVIPILATHAEVELPTSLHATQASCYYGVTGSNAHCPVPTVDAVKADQSYSFPDLGRLNPGQQMTVAVGFPKGTIPEYTTGDKVGQFLVLYIAWIVGVLLVVITFVYYYVQWRRHGRDPKGTGVIVAQYDAAGLTPLEVSGILHQGPRSQDFAAELIYLATLGYIKITETTSKTFIFSSTDYTFTLLKSYNDLPNNFDINLLARLFPLDQAGETCTLSALRNKFYVHIPVLQKEIKQDLIDKGYYEPNLIPKSNPVWALLLPVLFIALFFFSSFVTRVVMGLGFSLIPLGGGVLVALIIRALFMGIMPSKTVQGVATYEYILGLKEYLQIAEKDRLAFHNAPEKRPELFEALLPYAMVLGVYEAWAKEFADLYTVPPSWYEGSYGNSFNSVIFVHNLNTFSSMSNSTMSSAPGGSGGGGSAGGGGGGGGGGGW